MLLAHAPAGYLLGRVLSRSLFKGTASPGREGKFHRLLVIAAMLGGIFPDFDFIYHLTIDSSRTPHHSYFTHIPAFWLALWLMLFAVGRLRNNRPFSAIASTFCLGALLHLVLDTLTGTVYWFYPLSARGVTIFKVADSNLWWVEKFTHHWTFIIEIVIVGAAAAVFLRVKETALEIARLFRVHGKIRALAFRLGVCASGFAAVVLVGSMRFSLDNRLLAKAVSMKQQAVKMIESRELHATKKPRPLVSLPSLLRERGAAAPSDTR